jgi:hypothetical protein
MIPSDAAHDTVEALGEIGMLQFKDLNPERSAFQRTYANQVHTHGAQGQISNLRIKPCSQVSRTATAQMRLRAVTRGLEQPAVAGAPLMQECRYPRRSAAATKWLASCASSVARCAFLDR